MASHTTNPTDTLSERDKSLRILGLTDQDLKGRDAKHINASSTMYGALSRRFDLVDLRRAVLSGTMKYLSLARSVKPNLSRWRMAETLNPWSFRQRSTIADQHVNELKDKIDLVFQLHPLFLPGKSMEGRYVVTTDNTYRLSLRFWPRWVPDASSKQHEEYLELETEVLKNAAYIFPWSEFARRSMIEEYHLDPEKIIVVGSAGNLEIPPLTKEDYTSQTALFVGYDFKRKGGLVLLKAWETVAKQLPNAKLYIVGPEEAVADSVSSVHWLGRINNPQDLRKRFEEASVFVMPSLFEPWGHVFMEGMSFALPLIGSTMCAMPEFIHNGKNGYTVPPNDPESLAEALINVLSNPEHAKELGHKAYQDVVEKYTWDAVVERMTPYIRQSVSR